MSNEYKSTIVVTLRNGKVYRGTRPYIMQTWEFLNSIRDALKEPTPWITLEEYTSNNCGVLSTFKADEIDNFQITTTDNLEILKNLGNDP